MDYQGYKLLDKIMLVCRDTSEREDSHGYNKYRDCYQAYFVDPSNKKQLESARHWAKWTEYGPSYRDNEGKWVRDYEIDHHPVEFEFDNNGFELELLDCAGGSSQGGKLSFWNCLVTKDSNKFVIGINSDMLLDLLKNASFNKGKCQSPLIFITQKGKVGMTVEGSDTYKQCIKDKEFMSALKKTQTSKFSFGDKVNTATINECYLGTITQYYKFDPGRKTGYYNQGINLHDCTVIKLKNPVTYHIFEDVYRIESLTDILKSYDSSFYSFPYLKKVCPKRTVSGKLTMDCSEDEFKQKLVQKIYDFDAFINFAEHWYNCETNKYIYYFLGKAMFGFGFEPFELSSELLNKINAAGIKYVEE